MCAKYMKIRQLVGLFMMLLPAFVFAANSPVLLFSDLITGPDVGLGDGKGSGVIVTVWGQNLGSSQGDGTLEFCDSEGVCREGYLYYWKNADGNLPGGPANLFESHAMQEIAFSIPDSAQGTGEIQLTKGNRTSTLPFTVRAGTIYHVKSSGSDSGDGSWDNPWLTVGKGDSVANAGDTLYIHNVDTGRYGERRNIYNNKGFKADQSNQMAYVSYPDTRPTVTGQQNMFSYNTTGIVFSKYMVYSSTCADESLSNCSGISGSDGIVATDFGRVIGNAVTDIPGGCATGMAGAITTGKDRVSYAKIMGNYIYDYGCIKSNDLHHTTYITIRDNDDNRSFGPPEVSYNYLKNNRPKNGLHFFDENAGSGDVCGDFTGTVKVHHNVVVDQGSAGIFLESTCWTAPFEIYNNVLINTGLGSDSGTKMFGSAIVVRQGTNATSKIYNNTIYEWDRENYTDTRQSCIAVLGQNESLQLEINDNLCYGLEDKPYLMITDSSMVDNVTGSGNLFFTTATSPTRAVVPSSIGSSVSDPLITLSGSQFALSADSPLIGKASTTVTRDIYGFNRGISSSIGAVEFIRSAPLPPSNIQAEIIEQ